MKCSRKDILGGTGLTKSRKQSRRTLKIAAALPA